MQRISLLLAGFAPAVLWGQQGAGAELWRVAAPPLPVPPALATGGAAAFWNPAQPATPERASLALDVIETAPTINASGVLVTARARLRPLGQVGLVYGRMGIGDLVRTSLSPDPDPGAIPYYTQTLGANWRDRKSTRLNSSHVRISYAVFCLKKKKALLSAAAPLTAYVYTGEA